MNFNYFDDEDNNDDNIFGSDNSESSGEGLDSIITAIENLLSDKLLPKSVVTKLKLSLNILKSDDETQLKINRVQDILNEITEDSNLPAFVKTQIWNLASLLETV